MKLLSSAVLTTLTLLGLLAVPPPTSEAAVTAPSRGTTIQATTAANIRSGPDTSYGVEATAGAGDTASVLGSVSGDFVEVYYRNHRGWTHRAYWNEVPGLWVNGYRLTAAQEDAVRWLASVTIARVPGTLSERLTIVSRVTWWSLKEGILSLPLTGVHRFSNCDDIVYDPLYRCPASNWQVGIAGMHMSNTGGRAADIEALAVSLYPGWTVSQVLDHTANYAGYADGSAGHAAVVGSSGTFRTSWLLRNHGVGFTFNEPFARPCLSGGPDWCYGGWIEAARYAPHLAGITRAVQELRAALYAIRPI